MTLSISCGQQTGWLSQWQGHTFPMQTVTRSPHNNTFIDCLWCPWSSPDSSTIHHNNNISLGLIFSWSLSLFPPQLCNWRSLLWAFFAVFIKGKSTVNKTSRTVKEILQKIMSNGYINSIYYVCAKKQEKNVNTRFWLILAVSIWDVIDCCISAESK